MNKRLERDRKVSIFTFVNSMLVGEIHVRIGLYFNYYISSICIKDFI